MNRSAPNGSSGRPGSVKPKGDSTTAQGMQRSIPNTAQADRAIRKILQRSAGLISLRHDFQNANLGTLSILGDVAFEYMNEICRMSALICEHAGRVTPVHYDIEMALGFMGLSVDDIATAMDDCRVYEEANLEPPQVKLALPSTSQASLRIGEPAPRPSYVPNYLPPFPDPHTYIETKVSCEPDMSYSNYREICATNQRNLDASLINYMTTMHPTISLFRKFEQRLRIDARERINSDIDRKRQRIEAHIYAKTRKKIDSEANCDSNGKMPDDFLENGDETEEQNVVLDEKEREQIIKNIEMEEMLELKDTESSLVRKKLKPHFQILLPFEDERPYLLALLPPGSSDDHPNP